MNNITENFKNDLQHKLKYEYYNSYNELMNIYENAMEYLKEKENRSFSVFFEWFRKDGAKFFKFICENINKNVLDERFIAFNNVYKLFLEESVEEESVQTILEFLYMIPRRMKEDFQKFGFLASEKEEFILKIDLRNNINDNYYLKPGNFLPGFIILRREEIMNERT